MTNNALTYAGARQSQFLDALKTFLQIPSISTLPQHQSDINNAAQWLKTHLSQIGLENSAIYPTAGHPVVYADWLKAGPKAPTLLLYGHYDVQPVDPVGEWLSPPFEPTIRNNNIYARGATDDKGQLFIHLAALEACLQSEGKLPLNIKLILEGEEEMGSTHLRQFIQEHKSLLKANAAFISDTSMANANTPVLITGVRGLAYFEVTMRGSRQDLHSGIYGGVVQNPLNALTRLLASLKDDNGRVTIPGFYDAVQQLSIAERAALNKEAATEADILRETGAPALWGEAEFTPAERTGIRPTLDIHGIKGGFIGEGQKTVIPAVATAKLSTRLVPNQNAEEIARLVAKHIKSIAPPTMETTVKILSAENGATLNLNNPAISAASRACEQVFGRPPLFHREGGSIPVVAMFKDLLNLPTVMLGFGLPDDNLHAPNEKFHLPNFYRGIETMIHYYHIFAKE